MEWGILGRDGAGVKYEPATFYTKLHICQGILYVICEEIDNVYTGKILGNICMQKENHLNVNSLAGNLQMMRNYCKP